MSPPPPSALLRAEHAPEAREFVRPKAAPAAAESQGTEAGDAELMARTAAGDREAFAAVVDRYKDRLVGYLARITGSPDRAEDFAQEAFLRLYRAADRYREQGHLAAFLFRIATNLVRSDQRRAKRWRLIRGELSPGASAAEPGAVPAAFRPAGAPHPAERALGGERRRRLARAVSELPLHLRVPLVLAEIEEWPQSEIAELLGCRPGTVKSRLFRARRRLRDTLEPYFSNGGTDRAP